LTTRSAITASSSAMRQAQHRHQQGEDGRGPERGQVGLVGPQALEVLQPDELGAGAEGVLLLHALVQRLAGRPEEEHQ
jgi:hypothetical protein